MRRMAFVALLIVLLAVLPAVAVASPTIYIDNELYNFDPAPIMVGNRTLVPMRAVFEALGAIVEWEPETRTAIGCRDGVIVRIPIDSDTPTVNGEEKKIDVPARILANRTFIPLRFISEAFRDVVKWEEATQTISVTRRTERKIAPLVSTEWLENNVNLNNLVIIDLRSEDEYAKGHIEGAINISAEKFWVESDGLLLELPEEDALFELLASNGITRDSLVVVVGTLTGAPLPPTYGTAQATRVAVTLIYAGVKNVAILDGGFPKWLEESRPVTTAAPEITPVTFQGTVNKDMFVSMEYVQGKMGEAIILDNRDEVVYRGEVIEPFADKPGHIPSAKSLPTPLIWNDDSTLTYKSVEALKQMAVYVIGEDKDQEIIVYCGVGGYASSWWYVLTQILGYENVKFYDGSAQEWVRYNDMSLE